MVGPWSLDPTVIAPDYAPAGRGSLVLPRTGKAPDYGPWRSVMASALGEPGYVPATLQTFFSSGRDALCAMSSVRVVYSLGFACAQLLSTSLAAAGSPRLAEQSALCGAFTLLAAVCLAYLHFRICSIDATVEELAAAAAATLPAAVAPDEGGAKSGVNTS